MDLVPKGHIPRTMFTRSQSLRHTYTNPPKQNCIWCFDLHHLGSHACHSVQKDLRNSGNPAKWGKPLAVHQCLFCHDCITKSAPDAITNGQKPKELITSQKRLEARLKIKLNERDSRSETRATILEQKLSEVSKALHGCGFCKGPKGTPVRYCVTCQKYLCGSCYKKHQAKQPGKDCMYRFHATIDLVTKRNPDIE